MRAYHNGAQAVRSLGEDPGRILEPEGLDGLIAVPDIAERLARAIDEMVATRRWIQLKRMRGEAEPESVFQMLPGIGAKTAGTIHDTLHVDTLEALEIAAHHGRLEQAPGVGPRRTAAIRASLASMLARRSGRGPDDHDEPSVAELNAVDRLCREKARAGSLRLIAPRRFNPTGDARLEIFHTDRHAWTFTALFWNAARADDLDKTDDWVVISFGRPGESEHQWTVVTETHGPLEGHRVVRGRETEWRVQYMADG